MASEGNQFWKKRFRHGREKLMASPQMLKDSFVAYFEETDKRYWYKQDFVASGKEVNRKTSPPYTIAGFCIFVGASRHWWNEFRKSCEKKDELGFLEVIRWGQEIIELQQFEGAAIGAFNANIISRSLGLVDKTESEVKTTTIFRVGYKKPEDNE